jgi:hypothetical protein
MMRKYIDILSEGLEIDTTYADAVNWLEDTLGGLLHEAQDRGLTEDEFYEELRRFWQNRDDA